MICAQKVSLTSWLQVCSHNINTNLRCDLRSKSIFDILITGLSKLQTVQVGCDLRSKSIFDILITGTLRAVCTHSSCDLRSKSIFDILITGHYNWIYENPTLWFALKKYLWHPDYRVAGFHQRTRAVVICAQKVSLTSWLQVGELISREGWSCDLRSKSIFDILITGCKCQVLPEPRLWFALKKYLWHPDYRGPGAPSVKGFVVICAQKVSLTSWLQEAIGLRLTKCGCDLRSKSIFDILITGRLGLTH